MLKAFERCSKWLMHGRERTPSSKMLRYIPCNLPQHGPREKIWRVSPLLGLERGQLELLQDEVKLAPEIIWNLRPIQEVLEAVCDQL